MSGPLSATEVTDQEIEVTADLYRLDSLVQRYPDEARDLVARLAAPSLDEQALMDQESATFEERTA